MYHTNQKRFTYVGNPYMKQRITAKYECLKPLQADGNYEKGSSLTDLPQIKFHTRIAKEHFCYLIFR